MYSSKADREHLDLNYNSTQFGEDVIAKPAYLVVVERLRYHYWCRTRSQADYYRSLTLTSCRLLLL